MAEMPICMDFYNVTARTQPRELEKRGMQCLPQNNKAVNCFLGPVVAKECKSGNRSCRTQKEQPKEFRFSYTRQEESAHLWHMLLRFFIGLLICPPPLFTVGQNWAQHVDALSSLSDSRNAHHQHIHIT